MTAEHAPHTRGHVIHWARLYDLLFARKATKEHKRTVKYADLQPGDNVLDVGCGTGTMAVLMAAKVAPTGEVVGVDPALQMIEVARKKAQKTGSPARFQPAAIESLPFPDASFDVVTSSLMLHHLPDNVLASGLAEVRRVLKPGGRFVVMDFSSESHSFLGHLLSIVGHAHGGSAFPDLESKLHGAGFTAVEQRPSTRKSVMFLKAT